MKTWEIYLVAANTSTRHSLHFPFTSPDADRGFITGSDRNLHQLRGQYLSIMADSIVVLKE